jgi:hypothetical protein
VKEMGNEEERVATIFPPSPSPSSFCVSSGARLGGHRCVYLWLSVCVCVCPDDGAHGGGADGGGGGGGGDVYGVEMCVCVCVCACMKGGGVDEEKEGARDVYRGTANVGIVLHLG